MELAGFGTYKQSGLNLTLNQDAAIDVTLRPAGVAESVQVTADTPLLNTTNAEVGVRFDTRRVAELPVGNSRDIISLALQAPGVSQLGAGQTGFASGTNFSVNGMRLRSNNFMLDGQDSNDPSVSGRQQPMNNTDVVQEVRLITNQFAAEYGRAAGSVMNVITKSGTNQFRGSAFLFHNDNSLNARSNLDKAAGRTEAPFFASSSTAARLAARSCNQTFFFGSYQKWTQDHSDRAPPSTARPPRTAELLESVAGTRPQVAALLRFLPPAQTPLGRTVPVTVNGQTYAIPIGSLTGSAAGVFDNHQGSGRVDQQFGGNDNLGGRYMYQRPFQDGTGQVTPPGLTTLSPTRQHRSRVVDQVFSPAVVNEFRFGYQKLDTTTTATDPSSEAIPSIEIPQLGLTGFNAAASRTAIGLAVNLPQYRINDTSSSRTTSPTSRGATRSSPAWTSGASTSRASSSRRSAAAWSTRRCSGGRRQRGDGHDQQAAARWRGDPVLRLDRLLRLRPGRMAHARQLHADHGLRYETPGNSIASLYRSTTPSSTGPVGIRATS